MPKRKMPEWMKQVAREERMQAEESLRFESEDNSSPPPRRSSISIDIEIPDRCASCRMFRTVECELPDCSPSDEHACWEPEEAEDERYQELPTEDDAEDVDEEDEEDG